MPSMATDLMARPLGLFCLPRWGEDCLENAGGYSVAGFIVRMGMRALWVGDKGRDHKGFLT